MHINPNNPISANFPNQSSPALARLNLLQNCATNFFSYMQNLSTSIGFNKALAMCQTFYAISNSLGFENMPFVENFGTQIGNLTADDLTNPNFFSQLEEPFSAGLCSTTENDIDTTSTPAPLSGLISEINMPGNMNNNSGIAVISGILTTLLCIPGIQGNTDIENAIEGLEFQQNNIPSLMNTALDTANNLLTSIFNQL